MGYVKRKLAVHLKDWPWSSWYEKDENGLVTIASLKSGRVRNREEKVTTRTLEKQRVRHPLGSVVPYLTRHAPIFESGANWL